MVVRERTPDGRRMSQSMADVAAATSSSAAGGSGSGNGGASGIRLRRGSTSFDEHRNSFSSMASLNAANNMYDRVNSGGAGSTGSPSAAFRRRSSNFSDYSQDARDLLNPKPLAGSNESSRHHEATSSYDSLPLAFALLPAVGGLLFQGGDSFVTDLMLLGLGGIFLHWSVTQPWAWYHSSQQIREEHEANAAEFAVQIESDTEEDDDEDRSQSHAPLGDLQEEEEAAEGTSNDDEPADGTSISKGTGKKPNTPTPDERVAAFNKKQREKRKEDRKAFRAQQDAALKELFRHEVLALLSCFATPIIGAYLLHALRYQLTRPSEGLVSNFNLAVFILAAEVRPLRHLLQLVQARTLHLQRIVHANPYREEEERYRERREQEEQEQNQRLADLMHRFESLEQQTAAAVAAATAASTAVAPSSKSTFKDLNSSTSYFPTPASPPSPQSPPNGFVSTPDDRGRNSASSKAIHRSPSDVKRDRDQLMRDVRAQMQPELDTLARALRRTHKQQTLLEGQVVAKFRTTDQRLTDAMSLASAAAGSGRSLFRSRRLSSASASSPLSPGSLAETVWATILWASEAILELVLFVPRHAMKTAAAIVTLPVWAMQRVLEVVGLSDKNSGGTSQPGGAGETRHREGKNGRSGTSPSSSSTTLVDGSLRLGKKAGADTKVVRDVDHEYTAMPTSKARQNRFGLT